MSSRPEYQLKLVCVLSDGRHLRATQRKRQNGCLAGMRDRRKRSPEALHAPPVRTVASRLVNGRRPAQRFSDQRVRPKMKPMTAASPTACNG